MLESLADANTLTASIDFAFMALIAVASGMRLEFGFAHSPGT
jgi:ribonuclease PH